LHFDLEFTKLSSAANEFTRLTDFLGALNKIGSVDYFLHFVRATHQKDTVPPIITEPIVVLVGTIFKVCDKQGIINPFVRRYFQYWLASGPRGRLIVKKAFEQKTEKGS